ncbi:MAG: hypothetical protein JWQ69_5767 [Pseudomonas sp.]|nr:hypothetical protein [Pseudomonas sp.]
MDWTIIDSQMDRYRDRLTAQVGLLPEISLRVASTIAGDVKALSADQRLSFHAQSPVPIAARLDELLAFQGWMDLAHHLSPDPHVTRAQVLCQNYICFLYLPEACFRHLAKVCPQGSTARRCGKFLSNNPVRAFRNAIAHANWAYKDDFSGISYWARKDGGDSTLIEYEVAQADLDFWQSLSRTVAYATYSSL